MGLASFFLKGKSSNSKKTIKVESSSSSSTSYVCRDELNKKKPKIKKQVKFDLDPKYQQVEEPKQENHSSSCVDENANSNGVKVKILMKKEDAARLLLKCREGGVLKFTDVAHELVSSGSVRVLSSPVHSISKGSLKAIPEEYVSAF